MRKMATIRKIDNISPIDGADMIEVATVGGWKVVVKKGEYQEGQMAVYLEIDSWVPASIAPFLSKGEPREYMGIKGERLRTVKLKGQVSQGLLLPLYVLANNKIYTHEEGSDVSEQLGVVKWEPESSAQIQGQAKGTFPSFIKKTDQERCQNLKREIKESFDNKEQFEATLKMDGSSITVYYLDGEIGICSRNQELKINDENKDNSFIKTAFDSGLVNALMRFGANIAVQGELMGPGIQGNREGLTKHNIYVYDIFNIDTFSYLSPDERMDVYAELKGYKDAEFEHVPVLDKAFVLSDDSIDSLLEYAEGPSLNNPIREGIVFKSRSREFSFKAISNKFLLKTGG